MRFFSTLAASVLGTLLALGIVVFVVFFFLFALALSSDTTPTVESGSVLTVPVEGSIPETAADDPFQQAFGDGPSYDLRDLQTAFRNAEQDDRIEAVWLRMKGTSAQWGTLEEVRHAVKQVSDSGTPVIASSEEFGMSEKDYFVASAADSVYVGPQSSFEYNGFATILSFFEGTFEKLGVEPQVIRAGKFKSAAETFVRSDLSDENRLQLDALLSTINTQFTEAIAADRSLSAESLDTMAEEEPLLTASAAADEGLIDGLRHEDEVRSVLEDFSSSAPTSSDLPTVPLSSYKRISSSDAGVSYTGSGTVDVVYAEGNIVPGDPDDNPFNSGQEALGSSPLIDALDEARTNSSTQAVVLRINSPGGSASASDAMWRAVDRTAQEKPVIVSMGDVAASGGYYIAAAADTIMANPTTVTGSIGVIGLLLNAEDLFEDELGITFDGVKTSPYADMYSSNRPLSEAERRLIGQSIDQTYATFLQRVAEGRGMDTSAVHDVAQGRVWSGQDARDVGLVDTLGTLPDAVELAGRAGGLGDGPYRTRELPRPKTVLERLNESFSTQATELWYAATATSLERKLWRQKRVLDRIVGEDGTVQTRLPYTPTIE
ncbi:MAG: signal peptide peptidase SppA [Salinivenus sp.]